MVEYEPCAADARCHALLSQQLTLHTCFDLCRARKQQLKQQLGGTFGQDAAPAVEISLSDSHPAAPTNPLPQQSVPTQSSWDAVRAQESGPTQSSWDVVRARARAKATFDSLDTSQSHAANATTEGTPSPAKKNPYGDDMM